MTHETSPGAGATWVRAAVARNNEGQSIPYETSGDGLLDLVFIPDWVNNLEVMREEPSITRFIDRLASFSRLICPDKRAALLGHVEGGALALLFAATHPNRARP